MLDRIKQIISTQKLSPTQFADAIGVSRPIVSHILSGRNKPSLEVVQKIVSAFPGLSLSWLLLGTGPMQAQVPSDAPNPGPEKPVSSAKPLASSAPPVEAVEAPRATATTPPEVMAPVVAEITSVAAPEKVVEAPVAAQPIASVVPPARAAVVAPQPSQPSDFALGLANPEKRIRRIVIFYQDGTFSDFRPE
ncbi:helix-turn-helix domain-containing protein [Hymenobacter tenuis]